MQRASQAKNVWKEALIPMSNCVETDGVLPRMLHPLLKMPSSDDLKEIQIMRGAVEVTGLLGGRAEAKKELVKDLGELLSAEDLWICKAAVVAVGLQGVQLVKEVPSAVKTLAMMVTDRWLGEEAKTAWKRSVAKFAEEPQPHTGPGPVAEQLLVILQEEELDFSSTAEKDCYGKPRECAAVAASLTPAFRKSPQIITALQALEEDNNVEKDVRKAAKEAVKKLTK